MNQEVKYCLTCGAPLVTGLHPTMRESNPAILVGVSVGVFLIIFAVTYLRYPIQPSIIVTYIHSMTAQGVFLKPPLTLLRAAIFFFYAVGVWGVILSALKSVLQSDLKRTIGDLTGAIFSFFIAFMLSNYAIDVFSTKVTLAYIIIGFGFFVIGITIVSLSFTKKDLLSPNPP